MASEVETLRAEVANLREEVESLRACRYLASDVFSHAGCAHAEIQPGAVQGPGIHWSTNRDDAFSDLSAHGGWLLQEGTRYVVVECESTAAARRLRTAEQYEALRPSCSEVDLPEWMS